MRGGQNFASDVVFNRSNQSTFAVPRRRRIASIRNAVVLFPLVPVTPVIDDALGRTIVEIRAQPRESTASMRQPAPTRLRHAAVQLRISDDCDRSGGYRLIDEFDCHRSFALHGDEDITWPHIRRESYPTPVTCGFPLCESISAPSQ